MVVIMSFPLKMDMKIWLLLCFIVFAESIHIDHIELGRNLRLLRDAAEGPFTTSVKDLKIDLADISNPSGLQNLTIECAEDMLYLYLAMNDPNSVPPDFLQVIAMSKSLSIQNTLRDSLQ